MYKVREERLRNFYSTGIMDSSGLGSTKTPLTPSHGESLADHSFQSLKAKEIRDSESPLRDFRISHTGVGVPDTSGWNIVTTSEMSPDGRARKTESTATTEGVQQLPGGHSEFSGNNKHMSKMLLEGDDQNFVKRADESSATQLHERTVVGDENSGRVETKSSSTSSSSHVTSSKFSSTSNNPPYAMNDHPNIVPEYDDHVDTTRSNHYHPQTQMRPEIPENNQRIQNERYTSDDSTNIRTITNRQEVDQVNKTERQNIQKEVDLLAAQPGVLISRSVDYPDPNTKVITETKQLPDGTTVTTRKYETKSASSKTFRSSSNQQHNTSTRTLVEDRTQKNQIEYINDREAERIRQQQQQLLQNEANKAIRNVETNEEVQTTRRSSVQNIDRTDKSVRKESLINQVENIYRDNEPHRTVKKNLSQKYQDFIDNERGYLPEPERIHPFQRTSNTKVDRTTSSRETTTVTEDIKQPLPAAGKPSYNVDKPFSSRPTSLTPERSTPSRDSRSPPYSGKLHQQPQEYEIPIETSGYPSNRVPDNSHPRSGERQPSPYTKTPQSTPAAGKPSYNTQPTTGKPPYEKSIQETQQTSKEVREIYVEHSQKSPQRKPDYPTGRQVPAFQTYDTPTDFQTPQEREIPISCEPRDRQPYSPTRPGDKKDLPKPQEREVTTTVTTTTTRTQQPRSNEPEYPYDEPTRPREREVPINRPSESDGRQPYRTPREPEYDNRSSKTDRIPKSSQREPTTTTTVTRTYQPNDGKRGYPTGESRQEPNETYIPITRSTQPDQYEPLPATGKPSYINKPTAAAGKPSYTTPQHNEPYRAPSQDLSPKKPNSSRPNEWEQPPAGKPSYPIPRADENSPYQPSSRGSTRDESRSSVPRDIYPQEFQYEPRESPDRGSFRNQERPQYIRRPSEESRISTDTVRTNNTYTTKKISVEVDAAHDTFARSLRCVSPSDRGSVKSLRTSTTSVRSSPHSDKRSPRGRHPQRSPSRDSVTYSESSRISTSTVTKGKTNVPKDRSPKKPADTTTIRDKPSREHPAKPKDQPMKRTKPTEESHPTGREASPSQPSRPSDHPDQARSSKHPDVYRSNETIDLNTTRKDSTHHITTVVKQIEEYPGENQSPPQPSPTRKSKPAQITPKNQTSPKGQIIVTRNTTKIKTSQVPTSEPNIKRAPQKQTPSSVIGKPRQPTKPETMKTTPKSTVVTNVKRTTQSEITKTNKEPKRSPQQLVKNSHPDTPKAPKSPRSSPERLSRSEQPSRASPSRLIGKSPRQPERSEAPKRPAAGRPSDKSPSSTTKFTKTIQINNATLHQETPSKRAPKKPNEERPQGSDDEGFEPESPRSSSPTSSVSDLVYQKGIPEQHDGQILTTNRKTKTNQFIKTEKRDIETIENRNITVVEDDATFKRRNKKHPSPSPERGHPEYNDQLPHEEEPNYSDKPNYSEEEFPESDVSKHYPNRRQPNNTNYSGPQQVTPRQHSPSSERSRGSPQTRYPNSEPQLGPFLQPSDTDESYEPATSNVPRNQSPETQPVESTDEEKSREPFYLIEPRPSEEEDSKHPKMIKKPKTHPQLTRSETYEERCRKILGMDRQVNTAENTSETIITRKSPIRGVTDFITGEQTIEERNRPPKNSSPSTQEIPSKTIPDQREPLRKSEKPYKHPKSQDESLPDDTETYQVQETTEIVTKSYNKPREPSPEKMYPHDQRRRSPDSSPDRKQPHKTTVDSSKKPVRRSPDTEIIRKTYKQSRDSSPGKMYPVNQEDSPKRRSPDLSPNRKQPLKTTTHPVRQPPYTENITRTYKQPREPSPGKTYPENQRKPEDFSKKRSPETSPNRKQPYKSPTKQPSRHRSPDSSPTREYILQSPTRSPTRKPVEDGPGKKPSKPQRYNDGKSPSREEKTHRPKESPSPTRKLVSNTPRKPEKFTTETPSRRKPVETSPTRRPEISPTRTNKIPTETKQSPRKTFRETSPVQKPQRNEPYPTDKYCESGEILVTTTTTTIRSSPSRALPGSKSPIRKSPTRHAPDYETTTKLTRKYSPERSPTRQSPRDTSDSTPVRRPTGQSPTRKPSDRIPTQGKPENIPSQRTPGRGSSRSPSPRNKYTESVTIVTETRTKDSTVTPKGKPKSTEPQSRPSHVATAKIYLSPPAERKPSSIAVKKSPKLPNSTPTQTAKSPREDTATFKTPKSTVPRAAPAHRTEEKLVSTKRKVISTEESRVQEKIHTRKRTEEESEEIESEPEEEDSDINSDAEDVTTVIEATTTTVKRVPEKGYTSRKYPLTERKDSAPVYRATNVEKDKMVRSTSENLIKTKIQRPSQDIDSPLEKDSPRRKSLDKKRPIKCMTTKTITITGTDNLINSEDMENVIIDIQQAKSSREPSPNRIVPTPVRPGVDTGTPRYPDKVQEPEDEARRRPKVKDIPIFEEDTKDYVRCHISEVREQDEMVERRSSVRRRKNEEHDETVTSVTKVIRGRPSSPDHSQPRSQPSETDDEYRLTVHDKVAKFISTAEEVKKPKPSAPFSREPRPSDTEPDDCLLSVNEKVSKFLTTAEKVSKPSKPTSSMQRPQRPELDDIDDDLKNDESILSVSEKVTKFASTIEKLVEDTPQRSPKLVANIERQVSRKDEFPEDSDQEDSAPVEPIEPIRKKDPLDEKIPTRISIKDRYQPDQTSSTKKPLSTKPVLPKSTEVVKKAKSVFENKDTMKPKQRDILSRPSVWDRKRNPNEVKLQDIGVHKPFDDETEEIIKRERSRSRSPGDSESEPIEYDTRRNHRVSDVSSTTFSSRKNVYESHITKKSTSPRIPTRKEDTPTPYSSRPERQPSDLRKPDTKHPNQSSSGRYPYNEPDGKNPAKTKYPQRDSEDDEFIEEVTETTTMNTRSERRSPSRRCEYYSPERDSSSPTRSKESSPTRSHLEKVKRYPTSEPTSKGNQHPSDSSPQKYARHPDENTPISMKVSSRVDHTKSIATRKPSDPSPVRTHPSGKPVSSSPGLRPSYMEPTVSSLEHRRDSAELVKYSHLYQHASHEPLEPHRAPSHEEPDQSTPTSNVPSYMEHTISSIEHRRDSIEINKAHSKRTSHDSLYNEPSPRSAKFGVELKRTDVHDSSVRRKSSSSEIPHVEDIFDLDVLEKMLETVVGYEQRRRIRAQIRVVRKMIEEGTLQKNTTITTTKTTVRKSSDHSPIRKTETHVVRRTDMSPDGRMVATPKRAPLGPKDSKLTTNQLIESESRHITHHEKKSTVRDRSISPQGKIRTTTTTTEVRRGGDKPVVKKTITQQEEKPVWATKNILKKPSEIERATVKRTTTAKTQRQIITKDDADCITSSYGIGPTDEDGKPLFGIRALKKKPQQSGETTKITGSIVTESYYSENGAPPVGERKVTVYSNNPEDITDYEQLVDLKPKSGVITKERTLKDGITSVTRVQKIGKQKEITSPELPAITDGKTTTKQVKMVRKGSVKEMSEKFTKKGSTTSITEKNTSGLYPKAGLILRTQNYSSTENDDPVEECNIETHTTRKQSRSQMYTESDSETEQRRVTKTTKTFLNSNGEKITGVEDVLDRMRNADNVTEDGDTPEDREARSLLNKFLGASVLMSGVEAMVPKEVVTRTIVDSPGKHEVRTTRVTKTITSGGNSSSPVARKTCDIEEICDEEYLKQLLEQSTNYEERRRIRAQIRRIMAEKQEACTTETTETKGKDGAVVTTTTKVTTRTIASAPKPVSPFAKFRQLDKQNSQNSPKSPSSPMTPGGTNRGAPLFQFTDPALCARAATVKEQLLQWCQMKTKEYENVQITNFSTSWSDGLAFCALIHHFLPDAFDYSKLTPKERRHNFELAFRVADEKADIAPLLDVEDMVVMRKPDWKCVFTYVQSIFRRFRNSP